MITPSVSGLCISFPSTCIIPTVLTVQGSDDGVQKVPDALASSIAESENGSVRNAEASNVLVKEEEKEVGVVAFSVYKSYWLAVGAFLTPLILLSLFLMQG